MLKKIFSVFLFAFTFLFINIGMSQNVVKAEDLPDEILVNAGRGEKYWAVVNYGADYIGSNQIIIDIQKEAIADPEVNTIAISETENASDSVFYTRYVDPEFSSRINYVLKNEEYGRKYIVIFLLREFENNQMDKAIVDKIFVGMNQKRNISSLNPEDILITREVEDNIEAQYPYNINVSLNPDTIEGKVEDYVLTKTKYRILGDDQWLQAIEGGVNSFDFTVYRNAVYEIEIEDIFGYTKVTTVTVTNLVDPPIIMEVEKEVEGPINRNYIMDVNVYYFVDGVKGNKLNSDELKVLEYIFDGNTISIKDDMEIIVRENGTYYIYAETTNGSKTNLVVVVDNIDKEAPFAQVLVNMTVYTEKLAFFNPKNEIFVYDNVSPAEKIRVVLTYYTVVMVNERPVMNSIITRVAGSSDEQYLQTARDYLYTVRDIFIRYTVTDEAGNSVEKDTYVHSIDDTPPTVTYTSTRMGLYINDPYPTSEEIEEAYGIIVNDNSLYPGSDRTIDYRLDFSDLPVDENNKLNKLGEYRIFLSAIDESGNMSNQIILDAEVRKRLITIEADHDLYIVYGDPMIDISYHCVTRAGEEVPCSEELLEGDSISGELYVLNAHYSGVYEIFYDNISIPSDLYYLEYGDVNIFTIKKRTIKIVADSKEKDYLDPEPELTYSIADVCSVRPEENDIYKDYRCTLLQGDRFIGDIERDTSGNSEDVWWDETGMIVLPRRITQGTLTILEEFDGGVVGGNYEIDFREAEFTIWPKEVHAYIASQEKIYGELDPDYKLRGCAGKPPVDTYGPDYCMNEVRIELERVVEGEEVQVDADGNYIDYYEINGTWTNKNYIAIFYPAYLTILRRDIEISVTGDLDEFNNPTGKYTIYYEDAIPNVEVYDSSVGETKGLVRNDLLDIFDNFYYGIAEITNQDDTLIGEYVSGIGLYKIKKGTIAIVHQDGVDAEKNYNITFNEGILQVIKKHIWVKIIKELGKIYGDNDPIFSEDDLLPYDDYVILEANNRYIIEITPSQAQNEDPYIPRDNKKMKYHLNRDPGIYVGSYDIFIEKLEGCENYDVELFQYYKFIINERDLYINIDSQTVIYRDTPLPFTYNEEVVKESLQYDDQMVGAPEVEEYRHVGKYKIGLGTLKVIDPEENDVSFNYNFIVSEGILTVIQREIAIVVTEGQKKQYGENDPELLFSVYHNGILEDILEDDYTGSLSREAGEVPDKYYQINRGTFEIALNGKKYDEFGNETLVGNYLIYEFNNTNKFFIEKRTIKITARNVTSITYGDNYADLIKYDTGGKLAYNLTLKIDGEPIYDIIQGDLKIIGNPDGVGEYVISCEDIRIVRRYTGEDVTYKYYNYSYENGILKIQPRIIRISPKDGQTKVYGENDGVNGIEFTCKYEDGTVFDCATGLLDPVNEKWVGGLKREPRLVNDKYVTEDVGEYLIGLGDLKVEAKSGKYNYELIIDGSKKYNILHRNIDIIANDLTIYYGDPIDLTYRIEGDGLANNTDLIPPIVDKIQGELYLNRTYTGYGVYRIETDGLVPTNAHNYNISYVDGLLVVHKRVITVIPSLNTLTKVYGEEDPDYFEFTMDVSVPYSGNLIRDEGENVGLYRIRLGSLSFGPNYDIILNEAYFEITPRDIKVVAENSGKMFGDEDPRLNYVYYGTLIGNDGFFGALSRDPGEDVGQYQIKQGTLRLSSNYTIEFTPAIFTIRYAPFTAINIYSTTNNQYQVLGEETQVGLYARFNAGADETHLNEVEWKIIKNEMLEIEFTQNDNNEIFFTPSGSAGTYVVSASYGGITGIYEVYVEYSVVGNVIIRHDGGNVNQILGKEEQLKYIVIVPETTSSNATVQWIVNGITIENKKVSDPYFYYTPHLGKGEYTVQAKISNRISNALNFYVNNNNPPVITLNGDAVVYIEAKTGAKYVEEGAVVVDDIEGILPNDRLVITGSVNTDVIGTYFIKYDAKDIHGNPAISVYRQVVVRDTTPPEVTLNGSKDIKLLYGEDYIEEGAIAIDNYDGELLVTINNPIVIDKTGIYEVTYVAYDKSGNRGSATRTVEIIDNISPNITLIGDAIMYVEVYTKFEDLGALVEDNVDGRFVIDGTSFFYKEKYDSEEVQVDKVDTTKLGYYFVHYDYTDSSGNKGAGKIRTVVVRDSTPPVIKLKGTNPHIIRYSYPNINYNEPGAIATDNYDGEVAVTITGEIGSELGSYYIYYNAVDSNGNIADTVTREVIVVDIERPIIHFYEHCPQYITIEALYEEYDTRCDVPGYGLWVEDDYQADLEELQKRVVVTGEVDNTTIGVYVIAYDVMDMALNSAITLHRYITVVDTTAPTLKLIGGDENGDQIVEVFESYVELGVEVYDRYDLYHGNEIKVVINHNINVNKLGEYIVTYNAQDSNGNRATPIVRKVYVKDTTPPVVTLIGENPITLERGLNYVEYGATAIDNYDGPMDPKEDIIIINAPSGMNLGTYNVIYRAIDSSGNIGEAIRVVNVVDTIPPIVLGVEDGVYYKTPVSIYFIPTLGTDEVLTGWLNGEIITSPHYVDKDGHYDLLVRDDAGNETKIWFAIDTIPPEILGVKNGEYTNREVVEVYSNEQVKYFEYRYQSGDWVRVEDQKVMITTEGLYRIYAVDMADNISDVILFVVDRTPPVYTLTGVLNKGITDTDVNLVVEEGTSVVVNSHYNIPTIYTFTADGYYQVTLRDLAGNMVNLQFVINKTNSITVNDKIINIMSQHNAINKISIQGNYPRNSGYLLAIPLIEGGFKYVSGKLFSETEYQKLISGETIEFNVSSTDDTYMFAAFVVSADELNKFETQTVDDEDDGDSTGLYIGMIIFIIAIIVFFFVFFVKRRKREEDEDVEEETIYDDY